MEVRTNFDTFNSGDIVEVDRSFPYVDHSILPEHCYIIDKMIADAGVVTLRGFPYNKTFPDRAFILKEI